MKIENIRIQNVRGIADWTLPEPISKNRPHILVAPNGFGKTSIAKAFKSTADQTSLKLKDVDRYCHDESKKASLSFDFDDGEITRSLGATEVVRSNEIRKVFDILVISDLREVKAHAKNMGSFSSAKGKQVIPPMEICSVIRKSINPYKITEAKSRFGARSGLLQNLEKTLFACDVFALRAGELPELLKRLTMARLWKKIELIRNVINTYQGGDQDLDQIVLPEIASLRTNDADFDAAISFVEEVSELSNSHAFLALWQLADLERQKAAEFEDFLEWIRYDSLKSSIKDGAAALSKSWKSLCLNERGGKLVLTMPEPDHISNGQRDVLVLYALLNIARYCLQKNRTIIVIDEVFDYLDDANLTVVQYYLLQLINDYKRNGKELYLLILTHLNPAFFQNYAFSNQKVIHLSAKTAQNPVKAMLKLIGARGNDTVSDDVKEKISKYLVHYHDQEVDFSADLGLVKDCRSSWGKPGKFQEFLRQEYEKFKRGEDGDPLAICAITRRSIEQQAYNQICDKSGSDEFFDVHKTAPKLVWAAQRGATIPEFHYLLRIIFDDGLHWSEGRSNLIPIIAKLNNPIIRTLIIDAVDASNGSAHAIP
ncbi:MAG: hypothetical protein J0M04_06810 [Verrucomicrobia bacterium]|nr:hypothetical protein [Verrucomicrobiota bacterium]